MKRQFFVFCSLLVLALSGQVFSQSIPSDFATLEVWLRADSVLLNGGGVELWYDQSGNDYHARQAVSNSMPTYISADAEINGQSTLGLDGTDDFFLIDSMITIGHAFVVAKYEAAAFIDGDAIVSRQGGNTAGSWFRGITGATTVATNGNFGPTVKNNGVTSFDFTPLDTYHVFSGKRTVATVQNAVIGRDRGFTSRLWGGAIAELIVFDTALTDVEEAEMFDYLFSRYGGRVELGADTIHKSDFCPPILDAGNSFQSYAWSDGSSSNSLSAESSGTYWVTVTDAFGAESSDTVVVTYPGEFIDSFTLCAGTDSIWDTGLDAGAFVFDWSDGSDQNSLVISAQGEYSVEVMDNNGCSFVSDTIDVLADEFALISSLGPDVDLCTGNIIELDTIVNGPLTYNWNDNSNESSLEINSTGSYWLEAENANGCLLQDTINVTIIGVAPQADYFTGLACETQEILFTDLSQAPSGSSVVSHEWSFGDTESSMDASPTHIYDSSGVYLVTLRVETELGCSDEISTQFEVYPKPEGNTYHSLPCIGGVTDFIDSSLIETGFINSTIWTFEPAIFGSGQVTDYTFSSIGPQEVQMVSISNHGCSDTTYTTFDVLSSPKADFDWTPVCLGEPMLFTANPDTLNTGGVQGLVWDFGLQSSIFPVTSMQFNAPGFIPVNLEVLAENGCAHDTTITVSVHEDPVVNIGSGPACEGGVVNFTDETLLSFGDSIASWSWIFDNQGTSFVQNPNFIFNGSGEFDVALAVVSMAGCASQQEVEVLIGSYPEADFSFYPQIGLPPLEVEFTNLSEDAATYEWTFDYGQTSSESDPSHMFTDSGTVIISLTVTNELGCEDTETGTIFLTEAITDLNLVAIDCYPEGDYIQPVLQVSNNGNFDIPNLDILMQVVDGSNIIETWNDTIRVGELVSILPNSSLQFIEGQEAPYFCVELRPTEGRVDVDLTNNALCKDIVDSDIAIWENPLPNPATSELNFRLVNVSAGVMKVDIIDAKGGVIEVRSYSVGNQVIENLQVDMSAFQSGKYYIRLSQGLKEETFPVMLIK